MNRARLALTSRIRNLWLFAAGKPHGCSRACDSWHTKLSTTLCYFQIGLAALLTAFCGTLVRSVWGGKTGWATRCRLQPGQVRCCHLFQHDLEENQTICTCLTSFRTSIWCKSSARHAQRGLLHFLNLLQITASRFRPAATTAPQQRVSPLTLKSRGTNDERLLERVSLRADLGGSGLQGNALLCHSCNRRCRRWVQGRLVVQQRDIRVCQRKSSSSSRIGSQNTGLGGKNHNNKSNLSLLLVIKQTRRTISIMICRKHQGMVSGNTTTKEKTMDCTNFTYVAEQTGKHEYVK